MKLLNNRWIDDNGNSWCADQHTEEQAIKKSETLVDCAGCSECSNCSECYMCHDCSGCSGCYGCSKCSDCSKCSYCFECSGCFECSKCSGCFECLECSKCSGCSKCFDLSGCSKREQQTKWQPMDSLPETVWVAVLYKDKPSTETYILDYRDEGDREQIRTDPTAKGWILLPEVEL